MRTVDVALVREMLSYDPLTGIFKWIVKPSGQVAVGALAGIIRKDGYREIKIFRHGYLAHRLAWAYVYGVWPNGCLDHRNCVRDDNRIDNLRIASQAQNMANVRVKSSNTSGVKGVHLIRRTGWWQARISRGDGTRKSLGVFKDKQDAMSAYAIAAIAAYGDFARFH